MIIPNIINNILPGQKYFHGQEEYTNNPVEYVYQETLHAYNGFDNYYFPFKNSDMKKIYWQQNIQLLYSLQSVRKHYNDIISGLSFTNSVNLELKIFEILLNGIIINSTFWYNGIVNSNEDNSIIKPEILYIILEFLFNNYNNELWRQVSNNIIIFNLYNNLKLKFENQLQKRSDMIKFSDEYNVNELSRNMQSQELDPSLDSLLLGLNLSSRNNINKNKNRPINKNSTKLKTKNKSTIYKKK